MRYDISFNKPPEIDDRQYIVTTGIPGMEIFEKAFQKANNRDLTQFYFEKKLFTETEKDRVLEMIDSEDEENYTIAKEILKNKADELAKMSHM